MEPKVCENYGKPLQGPYQKRFCSKACNRAWYHHHGNKHRDFQPGDKILREFECKNQRCHRVARVVDPHDRRTTFCCQECEDEYWKHGYRKDDLKNRGHANSGISGGMSLGSLIKREKRDLD